MSTSFRQYVASTCLGLALLVGGAGRAGAQDTTSSTEPTSSALTTTPPMTHGDAATPTSDDTDATVIDASNDAFGDSLGKPNSGKKPESSGDRGTWPQYAVMGGVILGLVIIGLLARRQMRAGKVREGRDPDAGNV